MQLVRRGMPRPTAITFDDIILAPTASSESRIRNGHRPKAPRIMASFHPQNVFAAYGCESFSIKFQSLLDSDRDGLVEKRRTRRHVVNMKIICNGC